MTEADIKIAVYQDCIDIATMKANSYDQMAKFACLSLAAMFQDRIEEVLERSGLANECERSVYAD